MTDAQDHLASFVALAAQHAPSITVTTAQRNAGGPGTPWAPGISGYAWGINGRVVADETGRPDSLRFGMRMWFSDRRANPSETPPAWQQFAAGDADQQRITLSPAGSGVRARVELLRWGAAFSAESLLFEPASGLLLFVVPGAGPNAPQAVMTVALHPTGSFGFL